MQSFSEICVRRHVGIKVSHRKWWGQHINITILVWLIFIVDNKRINQKLLFIISLKMPILAPKKPL